MSGKQQRSPIGNSSAMLTGVGLGPGDPELITVKGLRAIEGADVVFVPVRRAGERSYALEIAAELVDQRRQRVVELAFPESADEGWRERCRTIVEALGNDRTGVFLTEGDPSLYSTFGHVARALQELAPDLRVVAMPGVSSVTAAAAAAGLSLAEHDEGVAILPATQDHQRLEGALRDFETVILIKVSPVLRETIDLLERLGRLGDATYVRRVGRPDQQVVADPRTLRDDPPRDYFSLIVVRRRPE